MRTGRELEFEVHYKHQPEEENCRHETAGLNEHYIFNRGAVRERPDRQAEGENMKDHEKLYSVVNFEKKA